MGSACTCNRLTKTIRFDVKTGEGMPVEGTVKNRSAVCLICEAISTLPCIRAEAQVGRMGSIPLVIVAEGQRRRIYVPFNAEHEKIAHSAQPKWKPDEKVTFPSHDVDCLPIYGMYTWGDAFTPRQLVALSTFSDLISEVKERVHTNAVVVGLSVDGIPLNEEGKDATAYADAVATYLALAVSKSADYWSSLCIWRSDPKNLGVEHVFTRQAIQMVWDYAEANPFSESSGNWLNNVAWIAKSVENAADGIASKVTQRDALQRSTD
jgi:putative DNA methylase